MSYVSDEKVYHRTCRERSVSAIVSDDEHAPHEKSLEVVVYEISRAHSHSGEFVSIERMFVCEVGCENACVVSMNLVPKTQA